MTATNPQARKPQDGKDDTDKVAKAIDRATQSRERIWEETKHRRNVFWACFGALIAIDLLAVIIWAGYSAHQTQVEQSSYSTSQYEDDDSDSDSSY